MRQRAGVQLGGPVAASRALTPSRADADPGLASPAGAYFSGCLFDLRGP